jgi:hypothetical protein
MITYSIILSIIFSGIIEEYVLLLQLKTLLVKIIDTLNIHACRSKAKPRRRRTAHGGVYPASPVKCLPYGMRSLCHPGRAYFFEA